MAEVVVSGRAALDLDQIHAWSADEFGRAVADDYLREFTKAFALLADYPAAGEERHDAARPYRVLPCGRHRLFYRIEGDRVRIVRILHSAQSVEDKL